MTEVILKNVRLGAYANLFTAEDYQGDGKFKHKARFLMEKGSDSAKQLETVVQEEAAKIFGKNAKTKLDLIRTNNQKLCFLDGDILQEGSDDYAGQMYLAASNATRPTVLNRDKSQLTEADGKLYGGCVVNAIVDVYGYEQNSGIYCKLLGVQFVADGDAFSGGGSQGASASAFDDLSEGADVDDLV